MKLTPQQQAMLLQKLHGVPDEKIANLAILLLIVISCVLLVITVISKTWFMLLLPITGFLIAGGYSYRIATISNPTIENYRYMYMLLIVPALLLAVVNYKCIGKITNNKLLIISFIIIDILCLFIQIYGVTYLTEIDPTKIHTGLNYIMAGLIFAIIVNIIFIGLVIKIQNSLNFPREFWICIYVTMILLLLRNIYKLVEFIQSRRSKNGQGYLSNHELYMYLFDFSIIFVALVIFAVLHYGFYL